MRRLPSLPVEDGVQWPYKWLKSMVYGKYIDIYIERER